MWLTPLPKLPTRNSTLYTMSPSLFSYNISRPYLYAWFMPVALIGGTIALALFSLLNVVSNGYNMNVLYATDPNLTVAQNLWFNHLAGSSYFASKVKPSCDPQAIPVNSVFFTNQTGLTHTISSIYRTNEADYTFLSALTYYNNVLENCTIDFIMIGLEAEDRLVNQAAVSQWGADLTAYSSCSLYDEAGITSINLTTEYNFVPETALNAGFRSGDFSFIQRDPDLKASSWWGESLLSMSWLDLVGEMEENRLASFAAGDFIRKGVLFLQPNTSIEDITDQSFLTIRYRFTREEINSDGNAMFGDDSLTFPDLISTQTSPNIWIQASALAKAFYSSILIDFGQSYSPLSNILLNTTTLATYSENFTTTLTYEAAYNAPPGPANNSYAVLGHTTGPLGTAPAVIVTQYLCQVPVRKAFGSLFLAVLVADLVFMQAAWAILNLVTTQVLLKKNPEANYCLGCGDQNMTRIEQEDFPMKNMPKATVTAVTNERSSGLEDMSKPLLKSGRR